MIFCRDVKDQKISARPADGLHPEEGPAHPFGGGLAHPFDAAGLHEGGVGPLGGGKDTPWVCSFVLQDTRVTRYLMCKEIMRFSVPAYL